MCTELDLHIGPRFDSEGQILIMSWRGRKRSEKAYCIFSRLGASGGTLLLLIGLCYSQRESLG
jgi:hypothetical protein